MQLLLYLNSHTAIAIALNTNYYGAIAVVLYGYTPIGKKGMIVCA